MGWIGYKLGTMLSSDSDTSLAGMEELAEGGVGRGRHCYPARRNPALECSRQMKDESFTKDYSYVYARELHCYQDLWHGFLN